MPPSLRTLSTALFALLLAPGALAADTGMRPIPDVKVLLGNAKSRQKHIDEIREDYSYNEATEVKDFDSKGRLKETTTEEHEIYFVNGHQIRRLVKKDGKPLDANEAKKEQDNVAKEVEKAQKTPAGQQQKDSISVSRMIDDVRLATPHREMYNNRPTIVVDFASNPDAKTHGAADDVAKRLSGTLWIDEADGNVARLSARLDDDFHVAGGLFASVHKGSTMIFDQGLVNGELWLPVRTEVHFDARVLLFKGLREQVIATDSHYVKFSVSATQQPGATVHPPKP